MNREEKINWLRRYRNRIFEVQQLTMELEEVREMAVHITPYLNDMPTSKSGNSHRLERSVEKVLELEEQLAQRLETAILQQAEIRTTIEQVKEEKHRQVLRAKYLLGQTWSKMAEDLYTDERWLRRVHNRAVDLLMIEAKD